VQQTGRLTPGQRLVRRRHLRHGLLKAPGDHGVHGWVNRFDPLDMCRDHLARRDLTAA